MVVAPPGGGGKVYRSDTHAARGQRGAKMRADEACGACDEDVLQGYLRHRKAISRTRQFVAWRTHARHRRRGRLAASQ